MDAIIFVTLFIIEGLYLVLARRYGIVDMPSQRSSHTVPVLQGGGVIFPIAAGLFWALYGHQYPWFMVGLLIVSVVSFVDDLRPLPNALRLIAQFAGVGLMFVQLGLYGAMVWWLIALAMVVSVGVLNAFNFMDGINGITGGYSLAVLLPLFYLNYTCDFISSQLLVFVGLGLIVFCYFNFRPCSVCFTGDVGAISIAFILVFALWRLILVTQDYAYIVFMAVYGTDAVLTICHRLILHEKLGVAHRKHVYQLMANELKIPQVTVSLIYIGLQLLISAGMIFLPVNHYIYLAAVVLILTTAYLIFIKKYYHLHAQAAMR